MPRFDPVDQVGVFEQHSIAVHVEVDLAGFPEVVKLPNAPSRDSCGLLVGDELLVSELIYHERYQFLDRGADLGSDQLCHFVGGDPPEFSNHPVVL